MSGISVQTQAFSGLLPSSPLLLPGSGLQRPWDMLKLLGTPPLHQQIVQGGGCHAWLTQWAHLSLLFSLFSLFKCGPVRNWSNLATAILKDQVCCWCSQQLAQWPFRLIHTQDHFLWHGVGCFRHLAGERSLLVTIAHRKKKNTVFGSFYSCEPPEFINTQMSLWKIILLRAMKYKYKDTTLTSKNHLWSLLERPQEKWDGKQKIKVAGNDWVGKIHPTLRVTCKRGESGLTFMYKDGPKMCIFLLCISPLCDFCS